MVNFVPKRNTMYLSVTPFPTLLSFSPLDGYTLANVKPPQHFSELACERDRPHIEGVKCISHFTKFYFNLEQFCILC